VKPITQCPIPMTPQEQDCNKCGYSAGPASSGTQKVYLQNKLTEVFGVTSHHIHSWRGCPKMKRVIQKGAGTHTTQDLFLEHYSQHCFVQSRRTLCPVAICVISGAS